MSLLVPARRFDPNKLEMIDSPVDDESLLEDDLRNLRAINRYFGGISLVLDHLRPWMDRAENGEIHILDLATGSADVPTAISDFAAMQEKKVRITAIDKSPQILRIAQLQVGDRDNIRLLQGDILNLDFPAKSFDIALCSLAIHHFSRENAVALLSFMDRVSRIGFIVNDLYRNWFAAWAVRASIGIITKNEMSRNDSYVSIMRAFTPGELREMAQEAGVARYRIERRPIFRLVLVGGKDAY